MNLPDETLLLVLVAFAAGVALGRFWTAIRTTRGAKADARRASSIHYILGLDFLASRQIDRAVVELTKAARENTEATEIYLILGNLLREKGQLERAIQIHQSVLHVRACLRTRGRTLSSASGWTSRGPGSAIERWIPSAKWWRSSPRTPTPSRTW
jgi:lipopolysaccharide biosynthesis regulator YciM